MKTTQTTTITKTMPKLAPKPQRQKRNKNLRTNQVLTRIVNTTANVAAGTTIRNGAGAKMTSNGNVTRVSHREFISDISAASSGFATINFAVNPGNVTAFPWLAAIAANYESYTFKKLAYRYVPLCPTSTQGRVTMAIDYDARDSIPTSKAVLSQYQGAVATPTWQQGLYVAQPANLTKFAKQRYVSGATVPANSDVKTYHVGQFILATSNTPATQTQLGELWVEYDVEFQTPQIATVAQAASNNERQPISGGAQRVKIGIRTGLPVFDTSFTDELHNILGQTWDYIEAGVNKTKFSILLNKYLNHPVLYLIKYAANVSTGPLNIVRPNGVNTGNFSPSFRQRGTSETLPLTDFSSIDLRKTLGVGISDSVNENLPKRLLAFIAYPSSVNGTSDGFNAASQIQFAYPQGAANTDSIIDIQSFALPPMMNSDVSNNVMVDTPPENGNFSTHINVETAGWLTLANQLSAFSSGTFRQVAGPDGEVKFRSLRQIQREENNASGEDKDELSSDLYHAIESVIKRIRDKAVISDVIPEE